MGIPIIRVTIVIKETLKLLIIVLYNKVAKEPFKIVSVNSPWGFNTDCL